MRRILLICVCLCLIAPTLSEGQEQAQAQAVDIAMAWRHADGLTSWPADHVLGCGPDSRGDDEHFPYPIETPFVVPPQNQDVQESLLVSGPEPGQTYYCSLAYYDASQQTRRSPWSNEDTIVIPVPPEPPMPPPQNFSVLSVTTVTSTTTIMQSGGSR